jgi:hypothetical protein
MANCQAPKFAAGISWAFPLQLVNLNSIPVRIYPYAPVAQLMISDMVGEPIGYKGRFQNSFVPMPPSVGDRERKSLTELNPEAVNRTFHIIGRDVRTRNTTGHGVDLSERSTAVREAKEDANTVGHRGHLFWIVVASTLSAMAFGVAGNLVSGGQLTYWQVISLVLLVAIGILSTVLALMLKASNAAGGPRVSGRPTATDVDE